MSQHDQEEIAESVEYLWSSNDSERNAGIERILQIGSPAADLLLRSLVALTEDQYPRFPKGREEEGKKAVEEYLRTEREFEEDDSFLDYQSVLAKKDAVSKLALIENTRSGRTCLRGLGFSEVNLRMDKPPVHSFVHRECFMRHQPATEHNDHTHEPASDPRFGISGGCKFFMRVDPV